MSLQTVHIFSERQFIMCFFIVTDYGIGYKWNPQLIDIIVGDTVSWQWLVPTYVTGIGYTVLQTADADSVEYDGSGFRAGPRSAQGKKNKISIL